MTVTQIVDSIQNVYASLSHFVDDVALTAFIVAPLKQLPQLAQRVLGPLWPYSTRWLRAPLRMTSASQERRGTPVMDPDMDTRYYEGCGREGPIRCIFLSEFHPVEGPRITCQFPEDYLSKEIFDAVSAYIIPKPQLQKCTMTINALGHKIIGYPTRIDSTRYERNAYLFNLCFVCDSWSRTVQYEPAVKKMGEYLIMMEEETRFVSNGSTRLPTLLAHLLHDLNTHRKATLVEGDTVMHLMVVDVRDDPPAVREHDVPIFVSSVGLPRPGRPPRTPPPINGTPHTPHTVQHFRYDDDDCEVDPNDEWDLTTRQLLPHINGYNHVLKIAAEADVDTTLVKTCIQNLVYYGVVLLMPILKFSNMYRACPSITRMFHDPELQAACLDFIIPVPSVVNTGTSNSTCARKPKLSEALEVLCALQQGTTLKSVCERFPSSKNGTLDVKRLVNFALLHGFIKCLQKYPIYTGGRSPTACGNFSLRRREFVEVRRLFTGSHSMDEICCLSGVELPILEKLIEEDPDVTVIWR